MDGCGNQCKKISNCGHHDSGREVTYRRDEIGQRSQDLGLPKYRLPLGQEIVETVTQPDKR